MKTNKRGSAVGSGMGWMFGVWVLATGVAMAAPEDDRLLASQCLGCHAADSTGKGGFDRLNGETASEIAEEMMEMRAETGEGDIMHLQARGYSDDQIRRIADWFALSAGVTQTSSTSSSGGGDDGDDDHVGKSKSKSAAGSKSGKSDKSGKTGKSTSTAKYIVRRSAD